MGSADASLWDADCRQTPSPLAPRGAQAARALHAAAIQSRGSRHVASTLLRSCIQPSRKTLRKPTGVRKGAGRHRLARICDAEERSLRASGRLRPFFACLSGVLAASLRKNARRRAPQGSRREAATVTAARQPVPACAFARPDPSIAKRPCPDPSIPQDGVASRSKDQGERSVRASIRRRRTLS